MHLSCFCLSDQIAELVVAWSGVTGASYICMSESSNRKNNQRATTRTRKATVVDSRLGPTTRRRRQYMFESIPVIGFHHLISPFDCFIATTHFRTIISAVWSFSPVGNTLCRTYIAFCHNIPRCSIVSSCWLCALRSTGHKQSTTIYLMLFALASHDLI